MSIRIYYDVSANAVFFNPSVIDPKPVNSLHAYATDAGRIDVLATYTPSRKEVANYPFEGILDRDGNPAGATLADTVNYLNAQFIGSGSVTGIPPNITSSLATSVVEGAQYRYQITTDDAPYLYLAEGLPVGLVCNPTTGEISGVTTVVGVVDVFLSAINVYGVGTATMTLTVIANTVEYNNTHSLLFKGVVYQNYLTVVTSASINQGSSDAWSLSFWLRMNTVQESILWSQGISSNYRFVGCDDNGALVLSFGKSGKFKTYVSQGVLPTNEWVHVVVTNTPCTMWINGVDATATLQVDTLTSATSNTQNMWICRGPGASSEGLFPEASLDELAYWDSSLSSGQVATLYNGGVPFDLSTVGFASHLKQWLLMGDGDAFPLISDNAVGGTHDATMTNMTAWNIVSDTP